MTTDPPNNASFLTGNNSDGSYRLLTSVGAHQTTADTWTIINNDYSVGPHNTPTTFASWLWVCMVFYNDGFFQNFTMQEGDSSVTDLGIEKSVIGPFSQPLAEISVGSGFYATFGSPGDLLNGWDMMCARFWTRPLGKPQLWREANSLVADSRENLELDIPMRDDRACRVHPAADFSYTGSFIQSGSVPSFQGLGDPQRWTAA